MRENYAKPSTATSVSSSRLSICKTASARSGRGGSLLRARSIESVAPAVKGMSEREFYELAQRIFDLPEVKAMLPKDGE